jgi:hypothetical protein
MAREGVPLIVIQRQLGHSNLGITSVCLQAPTKPKSSKRSSPARPDDPGHHVAVSIDGHHVDNRDTCATARTDAHGPVVPCSKSAETLPS